MKTSIRNTGDSLHIAFLVGALISAYDVDRRPLIPAFLGKLNAVRAAL